MSALLRFCGRGTSFLRTGAPRSMEDMSKGLLTQGGKQNHRDCCSCNSRCKAALSSFFEPVEVPPPLSLPQCTNEDLAPVSTEQRVLSSWDVTFLWLGLVVSIPTYYLAGSLVEMGMSWWQGVGTVVLANVITYVVLILNGHPGTKYGISFPVLLRSSFGVFGANVPALLRSFVACGWFGIETWIGGQAIFQLLNVLFGNDFLAQMAVNMPLLGTSVPELCCFAFFWLLQLWIICNGIQSMKQLDKYSAPVLVALMIALLAWAYDKAGGWGPMLSRSSLFGRGGSKEGQFLKTFFPALTANIGSWATLSINISDFTRYTKSQADQVRGQACQPFFMASFAFVGLAVTSATEVIYGRAISNPVDVLVRIGGPIATVLSLLGVILATLTTNIAANVVAPANSLVNLNSKFFSYRTAAITAASLSLFLFPWKLLQNSHGFVYTWLVGYSAIVGPIAGIMLTDYHLLKSRRLDLESLYSQREGSRYWYYKGVNLAAMVALVAGVLPSVPGFLQTAGLLKQVPAALVTVYDCAWFTGLFIAAIVYWIGSKIQQAK